MCESNENPKVPCGRSGFAGRFLNGSGQIVWVKAERSGLALIEDAALGRDQIEAVGPARVGSLHLVVEAIYKRRKLDSQLPYTRTRYGGALRLVARAAEQHLVGYVALHCPHVGGMSLKDIDRVEVDLPLVLF